MLTLVLFLTPLALVPYALAPSVTAAVAAVALVGGSYICILSGLSAVMQLRSPAAFRGRVLSLYFATLSVVFPVGALVQGALARVIGMRATILGGAAILFAAVAGLAVLRPDVLRALDDGTQGDEGDAAVLSDGASAPAAAAAEEAAAR